MGQVRHGCATTTHAVRAAIQRSQASLATLSRERLVERDERWFADLTNRKTKGEAGSWEQDFGLPKGPDPLPHHENIVTHPLNRTGWIDGPTTPEEALEEQRMLIMRDDAFERLNEYVDALEVARSPSKKAELCALYDEARALFEDLNARVGRRKRRNVTFESDTD